MTLSPAKQRASRADILDAPPLMKCGHAANALWSDGSPLCLICYGIDEGAVLVAPDPDLDGRSAVCLAPNCGSLTQSDLRLPFFEYRPTKSFDAYDCGCEGWN